LLCKKEHSTIKMSSSQQKSFSVKFVQREREQKEKIIYDLLATVEEELTDIKDADLEMGVVECGGLLHYTRAIFAKYEDYVQENPSTDEGFIKYLRNHYDEVEEFKEIYFDEEEDTNTSKYEIRWERAIYSHDGKRLIGLTTVESELFDDEKEAQEVYDAWEVAEEGELLYFDEVEEDEEGDIEYVDNCDCKGTVIDPELATQKF